MPTKSNKYHDYSESADVRCPRRTGDTNPLTRETAADAERAPRTLFWFVGLLKSCFYEETQKQTKTRSVKGTRRCDPTKETGPAEPDGTSPSPQTLPHMRARTSAVSVTWLTAAAVRAGSLPVLGRLPVLSQPPPCSR